MFNVNVGKYIPYIEPLGISYVINVHKEFSGFFIRKARWIVPRLEQISRLDIWPICFYENLHIISRVVEIDESRESFEFNSGSQSHIPMLFQQRPLTPEVQPENESSTRRDFQKNTFCLDSRPYCSSLLLLVIQVENKKSYAAKQHPEASPLVCVTQNQKVSNNLGYISEDYSNIIHKNTPKL